MLVFINIRFHLENSCYTQTEAQVLLQKTYNYSLNSELHLLHFREVGTGRPIYHFISLLMVLRK
jgi:hypothetical protein